MKTNMSKCALMLIAIILCAFSVTMVSINVASGGMQRAGVLLFISPKTTISVPTKTVNPTPANLTQDATDLLKKDVVGTNSIKSLTFSTAEASRAKPTAVKMAVFLVNFSDTAQPFTTSDISDKLFGTGTFKKFYDENSYGRQSITGSVFGWDTLGTDASNCTVMPSDLGAYITANNINLANFNRIMIIANCHDFTNSGSANTAAETYTVNGITYTLPVAWIYTSNNRWNQPSDFIYETTALPFSLTTLDFLMIHEFGHTLGLHHSHGISCTGVIPTQNCTNIELGNYFDAMADGKFALHFSGFEKSKLHWFAGDDLKTITATGTYTLTNLEAPAQSGGTKAYKIKVSSVYNRAPIWLEYRGGVGFDYGLNTTANGGIGGGPTKDIRDNQKGLFIYKVGNDATNSAPANNPSARLMFLRNSPSVGNSSNAYEVSMNAPSTFSDPRYGLTITAQPLPAPMSTTIPFQVTMNPSFACTHLPPKITVAPWYPTTTAGATFHANITLTNYDYLSCPNSSFSFSTQTASGITPTSGNLTTLLGNLEPDNERTFVVNAAIPAGTAPGTYHPSITLTNTTSNLSQVVDLQITVQ